MAFLAALTIAVLLIHNGLGKGGGGSPATTPTVTAPARSRTHTRSTPATTSAATNTTSTAGAVYTTVRSGDTYGAIAAREGTSVAQLQTLNPGVDPNALRVGQQLRVK